MLVVKNMKTAMDDWLDKFPPPPKPDANRDFAAPETNLTRTSLRRLKPEAAIDLHGLSREEAEVRLENFLRECSRSGTRKVLVIHGKGNHSEGRAVLPEAVRTLLEHNPHAGEFGRAKPEDGGSGALWVLIRQRSR
jgi:DNA-nicking Smr family endonuclease